MKHHATKKGNMKLMAYHYKAIELRYDGLKYHEISTELTNQFKRDFLDQTVRRWFAKGGMLEHEYLDYTDKENDRRRRYMISEFKKLIPIIPKKFDELLNERMTKTGKKLDIVTVATLKLMMESLGLKIEAQPLNDKDPLDEFFDRQDEVMEKENDKEIQ
jgi:hypothetical protein